MKKISRLLPFAVMLLLCAPAHAQLGGLLNRAKNAVEQGVSRTTQQATGTVINAVEGNDRGNDTGKSQTVNAQSSRDNDNKPTIPAGPEVPELMTLAPSWNQYDATGQAIAKYVWGLRKTPNDAVRDMADKLTARAKYDREIIAGMENEKYEYDYDTKEKLENELANWTNLYTQLGQVASLLNSAEFKQDEYGLWYYQGSQLFVVGTSSAGVEASRADLVPDGNCLFTSRDNKTFFCDAGYQPIFASDAEVAMAKLDVNMMLNIAILFEGYPVEYCKATERGVMADTYAQYYNRALTYAHTGQEAIAGNSIDNIEFKPMPKAGALNGSLKSQALAIEKAKGANRIDVVITSDSWEVQTNALGTPVRRVIYGYSIVNTENGKRANRVSWSEDYQGGSYGKLHAYGVGTESFFVK